MKYRFKVDNNLFPEEDFLKDCPNYPFLPTVLPAVKRIIAIGDIHGDYRLAVRSFQIAGLIDDDLNWIAKPPDTVVVQIGDQIDSCRPMEGEWDCQQTRQRDDAPDDVKILHFFDEMHKRAVVHGGAVYSLFGNHELINVSGFFKYVSYDNFYNFKYGEYEGPIGRRAAFQPGGPIASRLACTRLSAIIIGSNLFVHAGILPALVKELDFVNVDNRTKLKYLNAIVRKWLLNRLSPEYERYRRLIVDNNNLSPFWTRIFGNIAPGLKLDTPQCAASVGEVLEIFKIGQMIVGHTPQPFTPYKAEVNGTCNNRLFRIDGGFSKAFKIFNTNDLVQVLEITNDNEFRIISDTTFNYIEPLQTAISNKYMGMVAPIFAQN